VKAGTHTGRKDETMNSETIRRSLHRASILLAPVLVLLFLWTNVSTGAEYYQWTDENGTLHISNMPPEETPKQQRRMKTTRFQEPAPEAGISGGPSASPAAPGAAPVGKAPGAPPPPAAVDAAKAATAPGTSAASQAPAGGATTGRPPAASPAPSGAASPSEPFRTSQPPPDSTGQDADTARGAVNTRQQ